MPNAIILCVHRTRLTIHAVQVVTLLLGCIRQTHRLLGDIFPEYEFIFPESELTSSNTKGPRVEAHVVDADIDPLPPPPANHADFAIRLHSQC